MSAKPLDDLAYGLKTYAAANYGTYLTAVESGSTDGITLPDPQLIEYGYKDVLGRNAYPVLVFVPGDIQIEPGASQGDIVTINEAVVLGIVDNVPETLARKQLRYVDAFRGMVAADETLGGLCVLARIESVEIYPAAQGAKDLAVALINVALMTEVAT